MKTQRHSECGQCGAVTPDGIELCDYDATALLAVLRCMPGLLEDLYTTLSRQDVMGDGSGGRRSTETPLVFREDAAHQISALEKVLVRWVRGAAGCLSLTELPMVPRTPDPRDPTRVPAGLSIALYAVHILTDFIDTVRTMRLAGQLARDLTVAARDAERVVDKRVHRMYVGPCGNEVDDELCPVELYARLDNPDDEIVCPGCEAIWSVSERRAWLLDMAMGHQGRAAQVAALLRRTGLQVGDSTVREWARKGWITPVGQDEQGYPLYSISSVWLLAHAADQRRKGAPIAV